MTYAISALIVVASFAAFIFAPYFIGKILVGKNRKISTCEILLIGYAACLATTIVIIGIYHATIGIHEILF